MKRRSTEAACTGSGIWMLLVNVDANPRATAMPEYEMWFLRNAVGSNSNPPQLFRSSVVLSSRAAKFRTLVDLATSVRSLLCQKSLHC